jgi:ZIP family zinc transporter
VVELLATWFRSLSPVAQAGCAGLFTWGVTALGASLVLFTGRLDQRFLDAAQGFAAGVMIAASVWSLLIPAIELAGERGGPIWLPATIGLLAGAGFLRLADAVLPHLHPGLPRSAAEGPPTAWRRATLLVMAITLHNVPEGLAVGVAFGAGESLGAAVALAIGIGLQNFPEGLAVALPLRREGASRGRSLWYGQLSAAVEPVAAVVGAAAALLVTPILPYALAFAAGAMLYVVIEELIPESQGSGNTDLATLCTIGGFAGMMVLDVAFG